MYTVSPVGSTEINPNIINGSHSQNISTECKAQGGLGNQFQWIYLRTGYIPSNGSQLKINSISVLNGGTYECTVSNLAGNETKLLQLNGNFSCNK